MNIYESINLDVLYLVAAQFPYFCMHNHSEDLRLVVKPRCRKVKALCVLFSRRRTSFLLMSCSIKSRCILSYTFADHQRIRKMMLLKKTINAFRMNFTFWLCTVGNRLQKRTKNGCAFTDKQRKKRNHFWYAFATYSPVWIMFLYLSYLTNMFRNVTLMKISSHSIFITFHVHKCLIHFT